MPKFDYMKHAGIRLALMLLLQVSANAFADSDEGLGVLEQQIFQQKYPAQSAPERVEHLEQALRLQSDPRLSMSYRRSKLYIAQETSIASQKKNLANQAYNQGVDQTAQGETEAAIASYRKAIELNPKFSEAYNNLGNLLLQQNRYDETLTLYQQAVSVQPNDPLLHRNLGVVYEKMGKFQDTMREYEIYLKHATAPDPPIEAVVSNYRANRKQMEEPDYYKLAMQSSQGQRLVWPLGRHPIKVRIDMPDPRMMFAVPLIEQSLKAWETALDDRLHFVQVDGSSTPNILITLREGPLLDPVTDVGHTEYTMPEDQLKQNRMDFVRITLSTGTPESNRTLTPEGLKTQFYRMALHEVGHAIGIWGHSTDPDDIMFTHPIASQLSTRDVKTIRKLYGLQ